ncbi:MAG TPA: glycoside hydrolase family 88 protein [Chryseosolibacter sp.]|nr:glycoside hydrolase family 88 protein [Chryseosolibacter sp.]
MNIKVKALCVLVLALWAFKDGVKKDPLVRQAFAHASGQVRVLIEETNAALEKNTDKMPPPVAPRTLKGNELTVVPSRDWTSGFFSGMLWYLYEFSGDEAWLAEAKKFTARMEPEQWNGKTHDMGFKMYCSYGNGHRLTGSDEYRNILIQSAKTLSTRFRPITGVMRSWDHSTDKWSYPVIIDNMMNLELLFFATRATGDSSFYKIAVSHALTTLKNHYRSDNSSYHVVEYDTLTGKVMKRNTHQGLAHESAWSRGQAWGLYGYTMCYRETKNTLFLEHADKIARYILDHPRQAPDLVPYWDYDAPGIPDEPRDVSAATVTASALYELSRYSKSGKEYVAKADQIMTNLTKKYRSPSGENKGFILLHSTGSKPSNSEVDVPLIYADYYYLEALLRKQKFGSAPSRRKL